MNEKQTVHQLIGKYAMLVADHGAYSTEATEFIEANKSNAEFVEHTSIVRWLWLRLNNKEDEKK